MQIKRINTTQKETAVLGQSQGFDVKDAEESLLRVGRSLPSVPPDRRQAGEDKPQMLT